MFDNLSEEELNQYFEMIYGRMSGLSDPETLPSALTESVPDDFEAGASCEKWYAEIVRNLESLKSTPADLSEDQTVVKIMDAYEEIQRCLCRKAFAYGYRLAAEKH